jgi:hypothetical protein
MEKAENIMNRWKIKNEMEVAGKTLPSVKNAFQGWLWWHTP